MRSANTGFAAFRVAKIGLAALAAIVVSAPGRIVHGHEASGTVPALLAQANVEPTPDPPKPANRLSEIGPLLSRCLRIPARNRPISATRPALSRVSRSASRFSLTCRFSQGLAAWLLPFHPPQGA